MMNQNYWSEQARRVVQTRSGGAVERCHGIPHHGSYSNAKHQWGVAMLMHAIWPEDFPRLALACLTHDVPEAWVGDIPAPTCRYLPGLRDKLNTAEGGILRDLGLPEEHTLSPNDYAKLKCCDRLEFWIWSREQALMGNQFAAEGLKEIERYFVEVPLLFEAQEMYIALRSASLLPKQAEVMRDVCAEL